jgi:uncharacterized protein
VTTATAGPAGIVDYLCNSIYPQREVAWDEAIAAQGVPVKVRRDPTDSFADPPTMVARLDELGIATLMLATGDEHHPAKGFDFSRVTARWEETEALAKEYPGRFVGLWCINPDLGMAGVRRAAEALAQPWMVGTYNHVHSWDRPFDHADYYPFYGLCGEHGVPAVMQAGTSGGLMASECGKPIGIDRPAIYFRETDFVLSHTGWPWVEEAVAMALKFPNVYLGTAAYPPAHWAPALVDFLRRPGRRKVLFGTNFPTVGHRHALSQIDGLGLSEEAKAGLLGDNARRIFTRLAAAT